MNSDIVMVNTSVIDDAIIVIGCLHCCMYAYSPKKSPGPITASSKFCGIRSLSLLCFIPATLLLLLLSLLLLFLPPPCRPTLVFSERTRRVPPIKRSCFDRCFDRLSTRHSPETIMYKLRAASPS